MDLKSVLFWFYFFQEEIESGHSGEGSGEGSGEFDLSTINLAMIFRNMTKTAKKKLVSP